MSGADAQEGEHSHDAGGTDDTAHDRAIRTALKGAEAEESLKSTGHGSSEECGAEGGSGDQAKNNEETNQERKASKRLIEEVEYEEGQKAGKRHSRSHAAKVPANDHKTDHAVKKLLEESEVEEGLQREEKESESEETQADDGALVQVHSAPPRSVSFVQLGAQVSAQAQA